MIKNLIKHANNIAIKYASTAEEIRPEIEQSIKSAIENASTQKCFAFKNFLDILKQDGVSINFDITKHGNSISTSGLIMYPAEKRNLLPKYQTIVKQIEDYLTTHKDLYPTNVDYDKFNIHVEFGSDTPPTSL